MRPIAAVVLALSLVVAPLGAQAGAHARVDEDFMMPPIIVPPSPPASTEPARATASGVRERLRVMDREIGECVRTHLDETPRTLTVHVFVYPSGEWGLALGRVRTPPAANARGETPLEVCVADWVASSLGSHTEPFRGRRPRDVSVTYRLR
jgi:hypothetical protein